MSYVCPACGGPIASWLLNKKHVECPDCQSLLISNKQKVLRQCYIVALAVWLIVLFGMQHYSGSWGYAVLVSVEVGGILAAMMTMLYYRLAIRLNVITLKSDKVKSSKSK
ncbi:MAG: hypothetical protein V7707_18825 [Motiliproteus sp.]